MATDYRKIYEQHIGAKLPNDMHVHHLDHDRSNNAVSNLVAIPAILHGKYHAAHKEYFYLRDCYCSVTPPSVYELQVFNFERLYDGSWQTLFDGTIDQFVNDCQRINSKQNILALIRSKRLAYVKCCLEIRFFKQQQSKRA